MSGRSERPWRDLAGMRAAANQANMPTDYLGSLTACPCVHQHTLLSKASIQTSPAAYLADICLLPDSSPQRRQACRVNVCIQVALVVVIQCVGETPADGAAPLVEEILQPCVADSREEVQGLFQL